MHSETIILLCLSFSIMLASSSSKRVSWDYVHQHRGTLTPDHVTPYYRAVTYNGNKPYAETPADPRSSPWWPCYCYPPSSCRPPPSTRCPPPPTRCPPPTTRCPPPPTRCPPPTTRCPPPPTRCPPPTTRCPPPPTRCPPPLTCTWVSECPFAGRRKLSPCNTRRTTLPCKTTLRCKTTRRTPPPCTTCSRTPPPCKTRRTPLPCKTTRRTPPPCTTCSRTPLPCMTRRTPLPCTTRRTPPPCATWRMLLDSKIGKMQLCDRHKTPMCSRHQRCRSTIMPPIYCTC